MKFFIDTANIGEIETAMSWGMVDGVTTNPSLIAKENKPFHQVVQQICKMVTGPVSLEATSMTAEGMIEEGKKLADISENVVVKLPTSIAALQATKELAKQKISVNMTLCFSPLQGLLAAKAGAAFVSPFVGRLDDIAQHGMDVISQLVQIYDNYEFETEIIVASIRNPMHVVEAAMMGADISTIPFSVMKQFIQHPLTDIGIEKFLQDAKKVPGK